MREQTKITEPVHLSSDDVVVLKPEQDFMYQQCCDCKLVHRIEVSPRAKELRLKFVRLEHEFPFEEFTPETHVEFAEAVAC